MTQMKDADGAKIASAGAEAQSGMMPMAQQARSQVTDATAQDSIALQRMSRESQGQAGALKSRATRDAAGILEEERQATSDSTKSTPGTMVARPSSRHSATLASICSRTSGLISPVSPANKAKKPCALLLMTSISCNDTVCTTSLRFWSSPSGHCTKRTEGPIAS